MLCVVNVAPSRELIKIINISPLYKLTEISHELQIMFCSGRTNFIRKFRPASGKNIFKNCSLLDRIL